MAHALPREWLVGFSHPSGAYPMSWTKPEAEVVAVTMEVTAYVATL